MAMKTCSSSSVPTSYTATTFGWLSRAMACASRSRRTWSEAPSLVLLQAHQLEGHAAIQPRIVGGAHRAHAAPAQLVQDDVAARQRPPLGSVDEGRQAPGRRQSKVQRKPVSPSSRNEGVIESGSLPCPPPGRCGSPLTSAYPWGIIRPRQCQFAGPYPQPVRGNDRSPRRSCRASSPAPSLCHTPRSPDTHHRHRHGCRSAGCAWSPAGRSVRPPCTACSRGPTDPTCRASAHTSRCGGWAHSRD